jgi:hypothetical protein
MKLNPLTLLAIGSFVGFSVTTVVAEGLSKNYSYSCSVTGKFRGPYGPDCVTSVQQDCKVWSLRCMYYCETEETRESAECPEGQDGFALECGHLLTTSTGKEPSQDPLTTGMFEHDGHVVSGLLFASQDECNDWVRENNVSCLGVGHPDIETLAKSHCPARSVTVTSSCEKYPVKPVNPIIPVDPNDIL